MPFSAPAHPLLLPTARLARHAVVHAAPPVGWVVLAVLGYAVVLVPLVLWLLRRLHRANLAWLVLPLVAVCAAAGLWFLGRHPPGRPAVRAHASATAPPGAPHR